MQIYGSKLSVNSKHESTGTGQKSTGDTLARCDTLARGETLARCDNLARCDTLARDDTLARGDTLARRHFSME